MRHGEVTGIVGAKRRSPRKGAPIACAGTKSELPAHLPAPAERDRLERQPPVLPRDGVEAVRGQPGDEAVVPAQRLAEESVLRQ